MNQLGPSQGVASTPRALNVSHCLAARSTSAHAVAPMSPWAFPTVGAGVKGVPDPAQEYAELKIRVVRHDAEPLAVGPPDLDLRVSGWIHPRERSSATRAATPGVRSPLPNFQ